MKKFVLQPLPHPSRERCVQAIREAPDGQVVTIKDSVRTLDQNALLWPLLTCFAKQLEWPVNGRMEKLSEDDWKDLLTAAYKKEMNQRIAPGLNGGMVMLGLRTSKMGKRGFCDLLDFIQAEGISRGVVFNVEFSGGAQTPNESAAVPPSAGMQGSASDRRETK